ncbi:MAG: outer membrane beta-barrel protein [Arenimonas sp.]
MKRTLFALALAAALPMSAQASELSYSYVELDYLNSTDGVTNGPGGIGLDSEGYGLRGSFGFAEHFYVNAKYSNSDLNRLSNVDVDKWGVGFGYHRPMYDQADWFAEVGYTKLNSNEPVLDDSTYNVSVGIRGSISDRFEGIAKLSYNDGADYDGAFYPQYDSTFSASVGLQWRINEMWGIVGEVEAFEDATDYSVGVRASF